MKNSNFIDYNSIGFIALKKVDSTNNFAKKMVLEGKIWQNTMILAYEQTAGRGTGNKSWSSPKGNLYSSLVFEMPHDANLHEISFVAGNSVLKTLKELGLNPKCKWVNDVFVNMRKISGILTEQVGNYAIIGTGINIIYYPKTAVFYETTSLLREGVEIPVRELLKKYSENLVEELNTWKRFGFESILDYWKENALWLKERVRIFDILNGELQCEGILTDIDPSGALLIKLEDGSIRKIISGNLAPA